jgi:hypothetical protein
MTDPTRYIFAETRLQIALTALQEILEEVDTKEPCLELVRRLAITALEETL